MTVAASLAPPLFAAITASAKGKRRLQRLHRRGGAAEVQGYLEEERDCHDDNPNSWQHVFYQTLAANNWFVNGGFEQIADPQL